MLPRCFPSKSQTRVKSTLWIVVTSWAGDLGKGLRVPYTRHELQGTHPCFKVRSPILLPADELRETGPSLSLLMGGSVSMSTRDILWSMRLAHSLSVMLTWNQCKSSSDTLRSHPHAYVHIPTYVYTHSTHIHTYTTPYTFMHARTSSYVLLKMFFFFKDF